MLLDCEYAIMLLISYKISVSFVTFWKYDLTAVVDNQDNPKHAETDLPALENRLLRCEFNFSWIALDTDVF